MKQIKLSVVYAVFNEEKVLAQSLESVKDIADELIIVDGNSTDNTVSIAKDYGAKVISTSNKATFHINKQMAMDAATGQWILQMDADEVVDQQLQKSIIKVVETAQGDSEEVSAYWLKRKNWFLGTFLKKGGQYPDKVIRLFRKGKAYLPMKTVHEQMTVNGKVGDLEGHLLHYNSPTFADYLRKFNTYTSLTAKEWFDRELQPNWKLALRYFWIQPFLTFFNIYFRHRGYVDSYPGFIFAAFSGLHFTVAYIKLWELKHARLAR